MSVTEASRPLDSDILKNGSLVHPQDGATFRGRALLFIWNFCGLLAWQRARRSRLVIKPRLSGQSPPEAFASNKSTIEIDVAFAQYLTLDLEQLGPVRSEFVWRVEAVGTEAGTLAVSAIRGFSCTRDLVDLSWLVADSKAATATAATAAIDEAPPKPKVAKGLMLPLVCPNGDLELGTLQNWQGYFSSRLGNAFIDLSQVIPGFASGRHMIMTPGPDPWIPSLNRVGQGNYSVRLGNDKANGDGDLLAYTFLVTAQNRSFGFRYAAVLQDGHGSSGQPFFGYYILKGSSIFWSPFGNMPIAGRMISADLASLSKKGNIAWCDWTPVCHDLSAYLGQTMTIVFAAADCAADQHFGYAYIDGLCLAARATSQFEMPSEICEGAPLWANGTASTDEASHFWSIEESDANAGRNPHTEVYDWFVGQAAGAIDLSAWYASKGGKFKCNTYYRVKLAVTNDCTPWDENVRLLFVRCPTANAGADACVSCTPNGQKIQLGSGSTMPAAHHSYKWSPATGLSNPSAPRPTHAHGSVTYPFTYTLTVTDPKGCTASDSVTLYCRKPEVTIAAVHGICSHVLTATGSNYSSLVWSTGQTGETPIKVKEAGTYRVTASNPCGSVTASITITALQAMRGPFPAIKAQVLPQPTRLVLRDSTLGPGVTPAYNATGYRLRIFAGNGQLIWENPAVSAQQFNNGAILWNGIDKWGSHVPVGVYSFTLELRNCSSDWRQVIAGHFGMA